jgi:catechol 2,3-dioxygenase-like lactoylglutathione lyase family enzyme
MALTSSSQFNRLSCFGLTTANAQQLASFYIRAFGCRQVANTRLRGDTFRHLMGIESDARCVTLSLGSEIIELLEFDVQGKPYPAHASACDAVFQHFAVVTADMTVAWSALREVGGWVSITRGEPQQLPERSGGVTAFKFRDPEGHPLELLSFPLGRTPPKWQVQHGSYPCLGIDHSAIVVSGTQASIAFYTAYGLQVSSQSHNAGPEQDRLDGLASVVVDVTGLAPVISAPHVELLSYREEASAPGLLNSNDIAATRLIFESDEAAAPCRLVDPDGHHLMALPPSELSRFT